MRGRKMVTYLTADRLDEQADPRASQAEQLPGGDGGTECAS